VRIYEVDKLHVLLQGPFWFVDVGLQVIDVVVADLFVSAS
jgi:hypothetical protein